MCQWREEPSAPSSAAAEWSTSPLQARAASDLTGLQSSASHINAISGLRVLLAGVAQDVTFSAFAVA